MNGSNSRRMFGGLGVLLVAAVAFVLGGATGAPAEAVADTVAVETADMDAMKGMLVDGFERAKAWDLSLVDAIPASALNWAPQDDVRGYGDQIVHTANSGFIGDPMFGEVAPEMAVQEGSVTDKASLSAAVAASYDWIIGKLNAMPAADLAEEAEFFGGQTMPKWRIGLFALEHAMWTRGQVVPYLHANNAEIPAQKLF